MALSFAHGFPIDPSGVLIPFLQIKWEKFTESQTPPSFEIQDIL
jgi:hypothetical protein